MIEPETLGQPVTPETAVVSIRDMKIIRSHNFSAPNSETGAGLNLLILHQAHLDKCMCTSAKFPCLQLNIYQLSLFHGIRPFQKHGDSKVPKSSIYKLLKRPSLKLVQIVEHLNFYTKQIVSPPNDLSLNESQWKYKNDLVYIISNVSIYAFRKEKQTITEVQTSSIAQVVQKINANSRKDWS